MDLMIFLKKSSMASRPHETSLPTRWRFVYPGKKTTKRWRFPNDGRDVPLEVSRFRMI